MYGKKENSKPWIANQVQTNVQMKENQQKPVDVITMRFLENQRHSHLIWNSIKHLAY